MIRPPETLTRRLGEDKNACSIVVRLLNCIGHLSPFSDLSQCSVFVIPSHFTILKKKIELSTVSYVVQKILVLWVDKVSITPMYSHKPLEEDESGHQQAPQTDCTILFAVWCPIHSMICKQNTYVMVIHDTECPYLDQVSLSNTKTNAKDFILTCICIVLGASVSGTMYDSKPASAGDSGDFGGVRRRGPASSFLETKGFGWLMEVEDDDEDMQKPLLYVDKWLFSIIT